MPVTRRATPAPASTRPMRASEAGPRRRTRTRAPARGRAATRDEQAAGRLRVVGERDQLLGHASRGHVRGGEVAVARVAAGALAGRGDLARTGEQRQRLRLEDELHAAAVGHLVRVAEQPEAGHVGHRVRADGAHEVRGSRAFRRRMDTIAPASASASGRARAWRRGRSGPVPSGFVRKSSVARLRARLRPDRVRVHGADHREAELRLVVAHRVPAGEHGAGAAHGLGRGREDGRDRLSAAAPRGTRRRERDAAAARPSRRRRSARWSPRSRRSRPGRRRAAGRSRRSKTRARSSSSR